MLAEGELQSEATIKDDLIVHTEGNLTRHDGQAQASLLAEHLHLNVADMGSLKDSRAYPCAIHRGVS